MAAIRNARVGDRQKTGVDTGDAGSTHELGEVARLKSENEQLREDLDRVRRQIDQSPEGV